MIGELRFAGDLPLSVTIGVAGLACCFVMWAYRRETAGLPRPYRYLLPGLRGVAVALAILVLSGPVWHSRSVIGTLGRVVFAIDSSQSMTEIDSEPSTVAADRLARAKQLLVGSGETSGWIESLTQTHAVEVLDFSAGQPTIVWSSVEGPAPPTLDISPDGTQTDLESAIRPASGLLLADELESEDATKDERRVRAAVVLMTDGRDTMNSNAVGLAAEFLDAGIQTHAVGFGSEQEPADIGIVEIRYPESISADGVLAGEIVVKQFGMSGQTARVQIMADGDQVWDQVLTIESDGQKVIPFQVDVEPLVAGINAIAPRGVRRTSVVLDLTAMISPLATTTNSAQYSDWSVTGRSHHSKSFRVAATSRERQLLILDGSSRWEIRYLRNLFQRDPAWTVNTVLFGGGTDSDPIKRGDGAGQLPESQTGFAKYDAIVLGEVPAEQLQSVDQHRICEFVSRGGGMVIIDGRYDRIRQFSASSSEGQNTIDGASTYDPNSLLDRTSPAANKTMAGLVPVQFTEGDARMQVRSIRPTRLGEAHPLMNLSGAQGDVKASWTNLPSPRAAVRVTAKPDSEVWAYAVGTDQRQTPWLVTQLYGSGRVFYFSSDQTWRWRYKLADQLHSKFWNQLLAAAMQPPYAASDDYVSVGTDRVQYSEGDSANLRVRLQDTNGQPVSDATVDALLVSGDQVVATIPLTVENPDRGTYFGITEALECDANDDTKYEVRVRASGFDSAALLASAPLWVTPPVNLEWRRVSLNGNGLRSLVQSGGGTYAHETDAAKLLDQLRPLSSGTIVESDLHLWKSYYWFVVIIAILTAEWILRKQAGLV